jgi:hypothetical protein
MRDLQSRNRRRIIAFSHLFNLIPQLPGWILSPHRVGSPAADLAAFTDYTPEQRSTADSLTRSINIREA